MPPSWILCVFGPFLKIIFLLRVYHCTIYVVCWVSVYVAPCDTASASFSMQWMMSDFVELYIFSFPFASEGGNGWASCANNVSRSQLSPPRSVVAMYSWPKNEILAFSTQIWISSASEGVYNVSNIYRKVVLTLSTLIMMEYIRVLFVCLAGVVFEFCD